jgi:hypothetical protein
MAAHHVAGLAPMVAESSRRKEMALARSSKAEKVALTSPPALDGGLKASRLR